MINTKKIFKNIFTLSAAEFAGKGLQALFILYLANILGPEGLGIIGFGKSYAAYFALLVHLGFDTIGMREVAKNPEDTQKYVNSILSLRLILMIVLYSVLIISVAYLLNSVSANYYDTTDKWIIIIAGINIISMGTMLKWVYQGLERMGVVAVRAIISNLLTAVGLVIFVHDPDDTLLAMIIMSLANLINSIWLIVYYIRDIGPIKWYYDPKIWKKLFYSSFTIGLSFFIVTIYNNLDMTMIGMMKSDYETGIYHSAHQIHIFSVIPATIIQISFFPQVSRLKGIELDEILKKFAKLIFTVGVLLPVFFYVFADDVISLFGKGFSESVEILQILTITILIIQITVFHFSALIAWGYEAKTVFANIAGLILNVLFNIYLIPLYGAKGAATATIIGEFGVMVAVLYIFYKARGKFYFHDFPKLLILCVIAFIPAYLIDFEGLWSIIGMAGSVGLFIAFIFMFKIVSYREIIGLIKK